MIKVQYKKAILTRWKIGLLVGVLMVSSSTLFAQKEENYVREHYTKTDTTIAMRDGVKLYCTIYAPKEGGIKYPILLERTPYSAGPYGKENYSQRIGPNLTLMREKYIFVYEDVRGRYMSEGTNLEVTPHIERKKSKKDVDESSDTYDTVDWLIKNVKNNSGRVGIYGISYPGFYSTAALPDAHPAIKAVSPQAPVTDEFIGDDANHNGAFFLLDNFSFMNYFGKSRSGPVKDYGSTIFPFAPTDAYDFFLKLGPLSNTQDKKYFNYQSNIWDEYLQHDTYDAYWQARNIQPHLNNVTIPVLVVGGWFDAEDLYGALHTYSAIEGQNSINKNHLVMGPWTHGAWESKDWSQYASHDWGSNTSAYFQDSIEAPFFNFYLKDIGKLNLPEAKIFVTGTNEWRNFKQWPPAEVEEKSYFLFGKTLTPNVYDTTAAQTYTSDPAKPVPYTSGIYGGRNNDYMAGDQRFAAMRPDVLVFESPVLENDLTVAGEIVAKLKVAMSTSDADFVVKIIDVLPDDEPNFKNAPRGFQMAGFQRLVRAEVMRGKFRDDYVKPSPFVPGKMTAVDITLNSIAHTFKKGHKIMVQVQSSWFPLVDRNPQQFLRIPDAKEKDFIKSEITIYSDSRIIMPVLK